MLTKKTVPLMISMLVFGGVVSAQQDNHLTMYRHQMATLNPAVTAMDGESYFNISYESQWVNIDNSPQNQIISFGTPLSGDRAGVGFTVNNDRTFVEDQTDFFFNFSYKLQLSINSTLYLGIQAGGNAFRLNGSELNKSNNIIPNYDPALGDHSQFNPNVGVGLYLKSKKVFFSLSAPKILNSKKTTQDEGFYTSTSNRIHSYIITGGDVSLPNSWILTPYFLSRFVNAAPQFTSLNIACRKNDQFELGLEYNLESSIGANMLFELNNIGIGYAYSRSIFREINQNSLGSHELLLKIKLGSRKLDLDQPINDDDKENDENIGTKNKEVNNISKRF